MDVEYEDTNSNSSSQQDDEGEDYEDYEYIYSDNEDDDDGNGETGDDEDGNDAFSQNSDVMSLEMESSGGCGAPPSSSKPAQDPLKPKRKRLSGGIGMSRSSSAMMIQNKQDDNNIRMFDTSDLIPVMNRSVDDIAEMLAVSSSAAQPLLRHHKWVKDRLLESYTNNSDKEIQNAGVFHRCTKRLKSEQTEEEGRGINVCTANNNDNNDNKFCPICFDDEIKPDDMFSMPCGHEFCLECWACQMKTKMEEGPSCILATCPQAKCNEVVTEEEVAKVAPDLLEKFRNYQLRNFVDMNGTSRWCPGPGCDRIAAITAKNGSLVDADSIIATCDKCTTVFCIKCGNEPHQPMLCAALDKWKEKCKNESETANWILANTKACPKCRSRIEKNQGCNHMTCQQCKYEFCWICSGDWKEHGTNTGGYYNCNKFNENEDGTDDQSDAAKAKRELDRYLHYYKRYHAHAEAQKFAMKQLKETETKMMMLQECRTDHVTWSDVEFLKTANEQLVECRRVLKFTYVFAYYLTTPPKNNAAAAAATAPKKNEKKGRGKKTKEEAAEEIKEEIPMSKEEQTKKMQKERVEYHQEMLERFTENLSELVEKPLKEIDRQQVINQQRVVKSFMQKILEYIENGMDESYDL